MILLQCIHNHRSKGITIGDVYEQVTYSSGALWIAPVVGIVNDRGVYTIYPWSHFKQVEIEDV